MKKGIKRMVTVILVLIVLCAAAFVAYKVMDSKTPRVTNELVVAKLEAASELTTAKLTYNGLLRYEEEGIPFLTEKAFFMVYTAQVTAGIDISKVEVSVTKEEVKITVPEPEVLTVYVDPDSIEFYDQMVALFNWESKEDGIDAIAAAEQDIMEKADIEELIVRAREQTKFLLRNLFQDTIGERTLTIAFRK